jgi:hypothetical protein
MNSQATLNNLYEAMQDSPHQELICGGLKMLTDALNGQAVDVADLEPGIKKSGKIWADEMDQYLTESPAPISSDSEESQTQERPSSTIFTGEDDQWIRQYMSKKIKKNIYETLGHSISEEDQKMYAMARDKLSQTFLDFW